MSKKIADISVYQGKIDWTQARKELEFVIFRASVGMKKDANYLGYAQECGLPYAAYHYLKAGTRAEAIAEAKFFYECANQVDLIGAARPCFYICDVEYSTQNATTTEPVCVAFLNQLRELGCKRIGLYIGSKYVWAGKAVDMCDIMWIPRWGKNTGSVPSSNYQPAHPCHIWQYTSNGSVAGISGRVDLDKLMGDTTLEWLIGDTYSEPKPEPEPEDPVKEESTMVYDPQKVIDIALAEVGYLEKKSNSQLDDKTANAGDKNYTKYGRDLYNLKFYNGNKNGVAWCDVFVDWCFVQAYGLEAACELTCQKAGSSNSGAGCKYSRAYYKAKGQLITNGKPQPGDQIFFYPSSNIGGAEICHTGLVYKVDSTYVYTVEGNTSNASGVVSNGGGVAKKKYKLNYNRIAGYGRPKFGMTLPGYDPSVLSRGDKGTEVKNLQKDLYDLGYDLGKYGADGDFGADTEKALKAFQTDNALPATGIYDKETQKMLASKFDITIVPDPQIAEPALPKEEKVQPSIAGGSKIVRVTGDSVNVRYGDSTKYGTDYIAHKDDVFEYVATSSTGWYAVRTVGKILWVTNKYTELGVM